MNATCRNDDNTSNTKMQSKCTKLLVWYHVFYVPILNPRPPPKPVQNAKNRGESIYNRNTNINTEHKYKKHFLNQKSESIKKIKKHVTKRNLMADSMMGVFRRINWEGEIIGPIAFVYAFVPICFFVGFGRLVRLSLLHSSPESLKKRFGT